VSNEYAEGVIAGSFWESLPKTFLLSICSVTIPVGYTNDRRSHHPTRLKGGMFVLLNFIFNTAWIGLALGFTIVHNVPNTLHGVAIPQPSINVEVRSQSEIETSWKKVDCASQSFSHLAESYVPTQAGVNLRLPA
jgi:hypothetical protein